eukprot:4930079-Amphidinium_carterae.1
MPMDMTGRHSILTLGHWIPKTAIHEGQPCYPCLMSLEPPAKVFASAWRPQWHASSGCVCSTLPLPCL